GHRIGDRLASRLRAWGVHRHSVLPALALSGFLASRRSQSDLGAEPSPTPHASGTGVSANRPPRLPGRSLPPDRELAGWQSIPARYQLGQRAGGGLPRAFLGLALAHGRERDARSAAHALSDRARSAWPFSGIEPLGVFFAEHAPSGRGGGAARAGRVVPGISARGALGGNRRPHRGTADGAASPRRWQPLRAVRLLSRLRAGFFSAVPGAGETAGDVRCPAGC